MFLKIICAYEAKVRLNTKLGKLYEWWGCGKFLPSATVVAERLCFHRGLSVHRECTPPGRQKPPLGRQTRPLGR